MELELSSLELKEEVEEARTRVLGVRGGLLVKAGNGKEGEKRRRGGEGRRGRRGEQERKEEVKLAIKRTSTTNNLCSLLLSLPMDPLTVNCQPPESSTPAGIGYTTTCPLCISHVSPLFFIYL